MSYNGVEYPVARSTLVEHDAEKLLFVLVDFQRKRDFNTSQHRQTDSHIQCILRASHTGPVALDRWKAVFELETNVRCTIIRSWSVGRRCAAWIKMFMIQEEAFPFQSVLGEESSLKREVCWKRKLMKNNTLLGLNIQLLWKKRTRSLNGNFLVNFSQCLTTRKVSCSSIASMLVWL